CDADSSALARYVIALLKKDKSDKDLKRIMIEQLDVFLSDETTRFVERLFDAIASEEYLTLPPAASLRNTADGAGGGDASVSISELDLDQELALAIDGAQDDIEAVLAAVSSPPPPLPPTTSQALSKDNVINPDGHTTAPEASDSDALAFGGQDAASHPPTDTKSAFDHKTKDSQNPQSASHYHHHHVRSASPPGRSVVLTGTGAGPTAGVGYADKENQPRDSRRRRASLRSRSRSRSRSNERSFRRSRSRDRRVNEREKLQRQFRNKSPPGSQADNRHHGRRTFDRRRIGGNGDERARFGNNKGRRSHSRSMSPERNMRRNQGSPERLPPGVSAPLGIQVTVPVAPPMPVEHPAMHQRQRCRDFDEKGYCVRGETCPWDHGINPVVFEGINNSTLMMSMREYNPDAPEIWTRTGGLPPGAGGPGGPVPPPSQPGQANINPFSGNVRPSTHGMSGSGPNPMGVPNPGDYARNASGPPPPPSMMPFPFNPTAVTTPLQRQLIPIPVVDGGQSGGGGAAEMGKRRFELEDTVAIADVPSKRKVPINSRLGPRVNPNMQQHNSSLELRKVPRGLNTIAHLNNHFAKFGKIVNIQVSYEGDPEAAIVTFSTHAEANVAYRSTEAVLNNRFIKVFWHNDTSGSDMGGGPMNAMGGGPGGGGGAGGGRKNSQYHLHNVPAVPTPNADSAKISNANPLTEAGAGNNVAPLAEQASTAAPASMRLKLNPSGGAAGAGQAGGAPGAGAVRPLNPATLRKKQEEQQKAVHQLANGLRKRKQELLQSYVKQMKTALELVERMDPQDAQRAPTLQTIKVLQQTIDKLRKDVHADQDQMQAQIQQQQQQQMPPIKKTKEQQKKELLDMELELFAQQQEGNDTTAIQKRLEELQRNLGAVGGLPTGNGKPAHFASAPGAAANGGRKRPNLPEGPTRVDRRPKAIVVTGFAAEEADFVLGHFKNFGEISKHDVDREIPQLILSYATRLNAEQAVLRGKMYKDKRLQISWAPVVTPPPAPMAAPAEKTPVPAVAVPENPKQLIQSVSESDSLLGSDILPELRLEDEEEDEESEDRSWRR
ncbi:hypothetical protein KR018_010733, partial [Drosophila ironensis]